MSVGRIGGFDPNMFLQLYANSKGISAEEASTELKSQFGDPQVQDTSSVFNGGFNNSFDDGGFSMEALEDFSVDEAGSSGIGDFIQSMMDTFKDFFSQGGDSESMGASSDSMGIGSTEQVGMGDPDSLAESYAAANNISVEEAKEMLQMMFGDPQQQASNPFLN